MKTEDQERQSELLNAYLDGELDPAQTARLEARLRSDLGLRRRLLELRRVRDLVHTSFRTRPEAGDTPAVIQAARPARARYALQAMAAGLLLAIGITVGLTWRTGGGSDDLLSLLPKDAQTIRPSHLELQTPANEVRAIFHVASDDPDRIRATLENVEKLVVRYANSNKRLHVELVANAEGLNLLRLGKSPAATQVARIQKTYGNVRFLACGKTIQRIESEKGVKVKLLPNVNVASSALDQIILRLRQGWTYIRV
jgi:intracellular sulfur oxidation DsrE/DsrF family protein